MSLCFRRIQISMKGTRILNSNWKSISLEFDPETELSAGASMEA